MKKILFLTMLFCSLIYSQNIYFYEPTSTHIDYIGTSGEGPIAYSMYAANGWYIYHFWARLTFPDGTKTEWMEGRTGGWWVNKAGTYGIEGKATGFWVGDGIDVTLYRWLFHFQVVDNYAPSVPNNAQVSSPLNSNPVITWNANTERDMSGYRVYKKYTDPNGVVMYNGSVFTTATSYTDGEFTANHKTGVDLAEYWVVAEDINNHVSDATSHLNVRGTGAWQQKIAYESDKEIPDIFEIDQNFPNPFNPSTNISYSLPQAGLVNLKIFDLLGNEVAELINEVKEKGNYRVQFNGENLSSGVYIYTIRFKNFVESKRMILMK